MPLSSMDLFATAGRQTSVRPEDVNTVVSVVNQITDEASTFGGIKTFSAAADFDVGYQASPVARTATADGLTTGLIAPGTRFVAVTSASADNIVTLPAAIVGQRVALMVGATGYELRSSAPATVGINGGAEADAESAIAANTYVECVCTTTTNWVCWSRVANGTLSVVQVAAAV